MGDSYVAVEIMRSLIAMPKQKNRTKDQIISEMTDIIVGHLERVPAQERKSKIAEFERTINRGGKRERARPKVSSTSHTRRKSRRIPA
jgi:hypothetical protein